MKIRVHYHNSSNKNRDEVMEVSEQMTVDSLLEMLALPTARTAVIDGKIAQPNVVLTEGSEVFIFMQFAGG